MLFMQMLKTLLCAIKYALLACRKAFLKCNLNESPKVNSLNNNNNNCEYTRRMKLSSN